MHRVVRRELEANPVVHFSGGTNIHRFRAPFRRPNRRYPQRRDGTEIHARRWNRKIPVLVQVILQMKRLVGVLDGIEFNVIDVARQAPIRREDFHKVLPLCPRESPKAGAHRPIAVSLGGYFKRGIECAVLAELAVEREVHEGLDRRIRRCSLQASIAIL